MVINQFHAIGDLLFIEPICKQYWIKNGIKPILPVRDHLMWIAEYIDSATFVPMSQFQLDYESMSVDNPDYLPLRFANQIVRELKPDDHSDYSNTMPDKYTLAGLELKEWKHIEVKFNPTRAMALCKKIGLDIQTNYILVNENSQAGQIKITPEAENIVYMREIPGFTVIDWYIAILNAKENHHVSTSTFYLMQAISNKYAFNSKVFIYPRPNEDGLQGISKLIPSFEFEKCE